MGFELLDVLLPFVFMLKALREILAHSGLSLVDILICAVLKFEGNKVFKQ